MKELIRDLETILIQSGNPILACMDQEENDKSENKILKLFREINIKCCPELLELYRWKSGCDKKMLFEIENIEKSRKLCSFGNLSTISISTSMYKEYQVCNQYWFIDECLFPLVFDGIYEDPVLINLNEKSKDYKAIYYYSPAVVLSEDPMKVYDSIESWIETIIQCYKKHIYRIDKEGYLINDVKAEVELTRKLNPDSEYWFNPYSTW